MSYLLTLLAHIIHIVKPQSQESEKNYTHNEAMVRLYM